jgi:hypothetical protein
MPLSQADALHSQYTPLDTTQTGVLAPVRPEERIHALDLLRGWAMFGVLWSNVNDWYGTRDPVTKLDGALSWAQQWLVEERFFTLLCFLFGAGFAIQLLRAEDRGMDVKATYTRRSVSLLAIGLFHGLVIWSGDILTIYALVSFALVMFRTASAKRALISAALIWLFAREIITRARFLAGMIYMIPRPNPTTFNWILGHGSWLQIAPIRVATYYDWFSRWGLTSYFDILAMFLIGFWAVKSGYLTRVTQERSVARRLLFASIAVALVGYAVELSFSKVWPRFPGMPSGITDPNFGRHASSLFACWICRRGVDARICRRLAAPLANRSRSAMARADGSRRSHGADDIPHAVGRLHAAVFWLWAWLLRTLRLHRDVSSHRYPVRVSDGGEHLVAPSVSLRAS